MSIFFTKHYAFTPSAMSQVSWSSSGLHKSPREPANPVLPACPHSLLNNSARTTDCFSFFYHGFSQTISPLTVPHSSPASYSQVSTDRPLVRRVRGNYTILLNILGTVQIIIPPGMEETILTFPNGNLSIFHFKYLFLI